MQDLRIAPEEVKRRVDQGEKVVFVDARGEEDWQNSDVKAPGAMRVPADEADRHVDHLPGDALIVTYCT